METVRATYEGLPPECLLRIIAFLTLADVTALLRVSRLWNLVITDNEEVVYHQFARCWDLMGVPPASLSDALKGWASREVPKIQGWKQYCRFQIAMGQRWRGKTRAFHLRDVFESTGEIQIHTRVDRVALDTQRSLLVVTLKSNSSDDGCLVVYCLNESTRGGLFLLDQVRNYTQVDISNGFVVLTGTQVGTDSSEIWRWAEAHAEDPLDRMPTEQQLSRYESAMRLVGFSPGPAHRGELVPMGVINHPAGLGASRFVYPTLCVVGTTGQVWFWDIRTGTLDDQSINVGTPPEHPLYANCVDFNETHVFVASPALSVYCRASGRCVFQLSALHLNLFGACAAYPIPVHESTNTFKEHVLSRYHLPVPLMVSSFQDPVMGVQVSPTGDDFVAISYRGRILHIGGLRSQAIRFEDERFTQSSKPSLGNLRISLINVGKKLQQLAYDGRKILAFGAHGLCLIHLEDPDGDSLEVPISDVASFKLCPFPAKTSYLIPPFGGEERFYGGCSCLQMTVDSCWLVWAPEWHRWIGAPTPLWKAVGMIDFARAP